MRKSRTYFPRYFITNCLFVTIGQYKTWTADYGLGIRYGLRYKMRTVYKRSIK